MPPCDVAVIGTGLFEEDFGMHISLEDLGIDHFRSVISIAEFVVSGGGVPA